MFVHSARWQRRKNVSSQEFLAKIFHDHVARAGGVGLFNHGLDVVALAHIAYHRDDVVSEILLEPRNNNGGIESSRVGKNNFFSHEHSSLAGDRRRPAVDKELLSVHAGDSLPAQRSQTARNPSPRRSLLIRGAPA